MSVMARVFRRTQDLALTLGAVLGVLCAVAAVLALVLDLRVLAFRSGSMAPAIGTGDLAVSKMVPASEVNAGDVVTVRTSGGSLVTHRVVQIDHHGAKSTLVLRGDANAVPDAAPYEISRASVVLFSVPKLGYVGGALVSPLGMFVLGLYAAVLIAVQLRRRPKVASRHAALIPALGLVLMLTASVGTLGARSALTSAAWTDSVATTRSTFATGFVPAPASFNCGLIGAFSVTFNWSAVPGATSYYLHYGSGGSTVSTPITGTSRTITTLVSGGTAWVTANINYGSTVWTSGPSNTRNYSVIAISLCS